MRSVSNSMYCYTITMNLCAVEIHTFLAIDLDKNKGENFKVNCGH